MPGGLRRAGDAGSGCAWRARVPQPRLRDPDGDTAGTIAVIASQFAQFIERKRSEEALRYQALHDSLTGLPNRTLFHDRVRQALEFARRADQSLAVLVMDLDSFKDVNDTLGHQCGDALLQEVGAAFRMGSAPATRSHGSAATSSGSCS